MDIKAELDRLKRKNAELEARVQELTATCEDLKSICAAKGVFYEEALAARRHRRSFAQTYREHPVGATTSASEVLTMVPIGQLVADMLPDLSSFSKASRSVLSVLQQLPVHYRWRMGKVRRVANLRGHGDSVFALAQLDGGLLASGTRDGTVKVFGTLDPK